MLAAVRIALVARISAALVAATLSGAPRVLAMHAPPGGHRCSCRAHGAGHECECPVCRRAALAALASDEKVPPCHRALARRELAEPGPGGRGGGNGPCLEGSCGGPDRPATTAAGVEPFCLPGGGATAAADRVEARTAASARMLERPPEPETPPPKAA